MNSDDVMIFGNKKKIENRDFILTSSIEIRTLGHSAPANWTVETTDEL